MNASQGRTGRSATAIEPGGSATSARIEISLPGWLEEELREAPNGPPDCDARMAFVIRLAELNERRETGGPFAAAVFDSESHELLAAGVNVVLASGYSIAHAEVVAMSLAQRAAGGVDLGRGGASRELVTSVEPCAMCLGAACWSGIRRLVCGARGEDAEAIGFDEGPKRQDWVGDLEARGIQVTRDVMREAATRVLRDYAAGGGVIYNPRGQDR